jgi:hypothetical protein
MRTDWSNLSSDCVKELHLVVIIVRGISNSYLFPSDIPGFWIQARNRKLGNTVGQESGRSYGAVSLGESDVRWWVLN